MNDLDLLNELLAPQPWSDELGDLDAYGVCPSCTNWVEFSINIPTESAQPWDIARCVECKYEAPCELDWDDADKTYYAELLLP